MANSSSIWRRSFQRESRNSPPPPATATSRSAGINDDLQGRMLGDFRILRELGRGGMAAVYLAEQMQLKRNVAVKVMYKDHVSDGRLKRFQVEAMAAGSLSHPNIIQVLMIGEQDEMRYIAQEYVPGMNLREFVESKGPPD